MKVEASKVFKSRRLAPPMLDKPPPGGFEHDIPLPPSWNFDIDEPRAKAQPTSGAKLKRLDAFLAEYEPMEYAIQPIIRTGSLYTLTAKTGFSKTAWLISVALAAATGRDDILGMDVEKG